MVVFQILKDFKDKGEEELALEESMLKKTAAARRKAATRNQSEYSVIYIRLLSAWDLTRRISEPRTRGRKKVASPPASESE